MTPWQYAGAGNAHAEPCVHLLVSGVPNYRLQLPEGLRRFQSVVSADVPSGKVLEDRHVLTRLGH
jgi:hypothetical protein